MFDLIFQGALAWTGLAEAWRAHVQTLEDPPVLLSIDEFLAEVRKINALVSLEHCRHLGLQLQVLFHIVKSADFC